MCVCRAFSPLVASNPLLGLRRYESTTTLPETEKSDKPRDARENVGIGVNIHALGGAAEHPGSEDDKRRDDHRVDRAGVPPPRPPPRPVTKQDHPASR